MNTHNNSNQTRVPRTSRREFLRSSAFAAAGGALASRIAFPAVVSGANSTETLKVGLIGCGGRGTGAAVNALNADDNVALTAMGDVLEGKLQSSLAQLRKQMPERVNVTPDRCFLGLDAHQKVIQSDVDVVLLRAREKISWAILLNPRKRSALGFNISPC